MGAKQSAEVQGDGPPSGSPGGAAPQGGSGLPGSNKKPHNQVSLAATVIGGAGPVSAYHSSVIVNGEEFSFSDGGISVMSGTASHKIPDQPDKVPVVIDMGMSYYTGSQVKAKLERYFQTGTYDLLRKNCNSFSDCAIWFLLHKRIESKYRAMEKLGSSMQNVVASASGYQPNPKAEGFDVEKVCQEIDPEKVWATPGQATGGNAAQSAAEMRAARLARFSGGGGAPGGAGGGGAPTGGGYPAGSASAGAPPVAAAASQAAGRSAPDAI